MSRNENPPFERGATWYQGDTIDTNDYSGIQMEGKEWVFEDVSPLTGITRSPRAVRCRCVRNTSGVALLPKMLATFSTTAGEYGRRVAGYACNTPGVNAILNNSLAEGYPIDEYLPDAGVPNGDLFWIVIEGPAVVLNTKANASAGLDINVGTWVVAQTAAASTHSTTAGRVIAMGLTGATALLGEAAIVRIGRAQTARASNTTNTDCLIDVGHW